MKKRLWFTVDGRYYDKMNGIKKYQAFEYDTQTGELKFVDVFEDDVKEVSLGTAQKQQQQGGSTQPDNPGGNTEPDNP